jgi:hypothetical protein
MTRVGTSKSATTSCRRIVSTCADENDNNPTIGWLVDLSPEEVVIKPLELDTPALDVRVYFPRLGFVVQPFRESKL